MDMTKEQAIDLLDNLIGFVEDSQGNDYDEAFKLAIKALEQEPSEDCISRQAVIYYIKGHIYEIITESGIDKNEHTNRVLRAIMSGVETMPSVTSQQKMGRWKVVSDGYGDNAYICECSECKDTVWVYKDADRKWNYCPNCGAKMEAE